MRDEFLVALRSASLHVRLLLIQRLLGRAGFGDIEIMDRRMEGQRSRNLGYELTCHSVKGTLPIRILVKVTKEHGRLRMVDELASVVHREQAHAGLLVVLNQVAASVRTFQFSRLCSPVEVVEPFTLLPLFHRHGVAVRPAGGVDYAYLEELEMQSEQLLAALRDGAAR